jgi:hypothetical protein
MPSRLLRTDLRLSLVLPTDSATRTACSACSKLLAAMNELAALGATTPIRSRISEP